MRCRLGASLGLALALTAASSRADMPTIGGKLTVAPELAHQVGPDDRLILKLYRPQDGIEMDATYRIVQSFTLPFAFQAALSIDMNRRTKYDAYVLELFTDKNDDVLAVAPGELIAHADPGAAWNARPAAGAERGSRMSRTMPPAALRCRRSACR